MLTTRSLEVAPHGMEVLRLVVIIYSNCSSIKLLVMAQCSTFCVHTAVSTHVPDN
jgi:hypothetical protein